MSWLSQLPREDSDLLRALHDTVKEMWQPCDAGQIKETKNGFSATFERLPMEIDLLSLSDLVTRFKPRISDVTVFWADHAMSLSFELLSSSSSSAAAHRYPRYAPVDAIPTHLREALAASKDFDIRMVPQGWEFTCNQLCRLMDIFYGRGHDISVPLTSLFVEPGEPTWVEFENTERISYSFLEYLCSHVHIASIVARADGAALCFEMGAGELLPLLAARS
jgi:hypothetical protein